MTDITKVIIQKIEASVLKLYHNDGWLLERDLSERSIAHRLAIYLQEEYPDYHVDCEYNGDEQDPMGRKRIHAVTSNLIGLGLLKESEDAESDLTERTVYPDIIIHERGRNDRNLCVFEIKKSSSRIDFAYDAIKLSNYTSSKFGNHLKYALGVFIEFNTGQGEKKHKCKYFVDGKEIDLEGQVI